MKCKDSYISIDMWAGRYVLFIVIIYNSTYIIWITLNSYYLTGSLIQLASST